MTQKIDITALSLQELESLAYQEWEQIQLHQANFQSLRQAIEMKRQQAEQRESDQKDADPRKK